MSNLNGDNPKTAAKNTGIKFDGAKIRWDLLEIKPVEAIIRVLMYGANKYGDRNWVLVPDAQRRYYSACMRHLTAWWDGEKKDPESGESHLSHAATCLIFLLWHEQNPNKPEEQEMEVEIAEIDVPQTKIRNCGPDSISTMDRLRIRLREWRARF